MEAAVFMPAASLTGHICLPFLRPLRVSVMPVMPGVLLHFIRVDLSGTAIRSASILPDLACTAHCACGRGVA